MKRIKDPVLVYIYIYTTSTSAHLSLYIYIFITPTSPNFLGGHFTECTDTRSSNVLAIGMGLVSG